MAKKHRIELDEIDLGQLLDALEIRAETWDKTAQYHRTGEQSVDSWQVAVGGAGPIEECNSAEEAERIAQHYRSIIDSIRRQTQSGRSNG